MTRVSAVQLAPVVGDLAGNLRLVRDALEREIEDGADVVVLPELATSGYVFRDEAEADALALVATDAVFAEWRAAAARLSDGRGGVIVVGFAERGTDGRLYNSAALLDRDGLLGVYRKVHLWDREKTVFQPGDAAPLVVDTAHGRVGVMICFDLEFPEWTRIAALDGAELLAVPTNWPLVETPAGERPPEVQIAIGVARSNRMAVACADRCGTERGVDWNEGTTIIDADGWVRSQVGAGQGSARAELDLTASRDKTASSLVDLLGDRRPDLYARLLDPKA